MAIRFYTDILREEAWPALWIESNGDIRGYLKEKYNATIAPYDVNRKCAVFLFSSKTKYMEFCLRWL